jgi:hypothetical protein
MKRREGFYLILLDEMVPQRANLITAMKLRYLSARAGCLAFGDEAINHQSD